MAGVFGFALREGLDRWWEEHIQASWMTTYQYTNVTDRVGGSIFPRPRWRCWVCPALRMGWENLHKAASRSLAIFHRLLPRSLRCRDRKNYLADAIPGKATARQKFRERLGGSAAVGRQH